MTTKTCDCFDDLLLRYPEGAIDPNVKGRIDAENDGKRARFFMAVRHLLSKRFAFPVQIPVFPRIPLTGGARTRDVLKGLSLDNKAYFAGVAGILLAENYGDPLLGRPDTISSSADDIVVSEDVEGTKRDVVIVRRFVEASVRAVQEYNASADLYLAVFKQLREEGETEVGDERVFSISVRQVAEVTRRLVEQGVHARDPQLRRKVVNALSTAIGGGIERRSSAIDIDLPDLEEGTEADIIADNVRALSAVYFAAMLEDLKCFAVVDKVCEMFMQGTIPVSRGPGGELLYNYIREASQRMTEVERRSLYARALGVAQGSVDEPMANREFGDLWIRFLSAVSRLTRETDSTERKTLTAVQVSKAARDLAVNLSLHGYGMAHFAAVELQKLVRDVNTMLSSAEICAAFGARDRWQLVEVVAGRHLGGSANGVRQRTMAQAGAKIIQWLADNSPNLTSSSGTTLQVDGVLVNHVEKWLAVTGTPDSAVERYAEPVAVQNQRTVPDFGGFGGDMVRDAVAKLGALNPISN